MNPALSLSNNGHPAQKTDTLDLAESIRVIFIQSGQTVRVKRYLPPQEAADLLGMSVETLSLWRKQAKGPAYSKLGKSVRYSVSDLDAFMEARRVLTISMAS